MLEEKLSSYSKSDMYPFHMPGHKRRMEAENPYAVDITEIGGFDNLHSPTGVLRDAQQLAARVYGADRCYFLVNGSTCGLLAAICAATRKGDRVLMARNCHRAVYHAVFLQELSPVYLYPTVTACGIQGRISPEEAERALAENPDIRAVILTSPTYDGVVSDVRAIADAAHRRGIPLIVDAAHGAHFGFCGYFPENAVALGADIAVESVHKTLPALTQTALLFLCGGRVDKRAVERYLDIFQTSSPSYPLMAGIERCVRMLAERGRELFSEFSRRLERFYGETAGLKRLHVLRWEELLAAEAYGFDPSKLLIFSGQAGLCGSELQRRLRKDHRIETEMACANYTLALSSVMDTQEGFDRLRKALFQIDAALAEGNTEPFPARVRFSDAAVYRRLECALKISDALTRECRSVPLEESAGCVSGAYVSLYPPGIPLVIPGERIDETLISDILCCRRLGLDVQGISGGSAQIQVVIF